jgi:alkylation response protein AidB-like acyl-CoA dehydrogenase
MIDIRLAAEQQEFARSLTRLVQRHQAERAREATPQLWAALSEVGFLGLCSPGAGGNPVDLVTCMQALGAVGCPGPLVAASAAAVLLDGDRLDALVAGELVVTLTDGHHVPWGSSADLVLELASDGAWVVDVLGATSVPTLSGESWSMGRARRVERLGGAARAIAIAELALAGYLLGAAGAVIEQAAAHARVRVQFGKPIGDFQAVAHPLARSIADVGATLELLRLLAREQVLDAALIRGARVQAGRTACVAAERAHQAFGAVGFAVETGVSTISTRIRQWSALPIGGGQSVPAE